MDWVRKGLFETQLFGPTERVSISQLLGSKVAWQGRKHEVRLKCSQGIAPCSSAYNESRTALGHNMTNYLFLKYELAQNRLVFQTCRFHDFGEKRGSLLWQGLGPHTAI